MIQVGYVASNKNKSEKGKIDYRDLDLLRRSVNLNSKGYARVGKYKLHILVMERILGGPIPKGRLVDHKNRNRLDNTRKNLRLVSAYENSLNIDKTRCTSKYPGVSWKASKNKWYAQIKKEGKTKYLGVFDNQEDAAKAYNKEASILHGESIS